jgi:methylmalonyl-CoA mutase N-terminal domain/subunit
MIQQRISEVAQQSNEAFLKNEVIVTGINKYRNEKEKIALSDVRLNFLKNLQIENPALRFELQNFFN